MMRTIVVAMDGPAGAGKSTVARRLAQSLGYILLDTGAIYRAVALAAARRGIAWTDERKLTDLVEDLVCRERLTIRVLDGGAMTVALDGVDVAHEIRTPAISQGASLVSSWPGVRGPLLSVQRRFVAGGSARGVVAEGRDIGTVVFPDADLKIFLTASLEARAHRRHEELLARGYTANFAETLTEVETRDRNDEQRTIAPLRRAADATLVDSTGRTLDDVLQQCIELVHARIGATDAAAGSSREGRKGS